ncbi:MAG: hypothetical protein ACRD2N_17670 [Vicinamibacterales bacterium]
MTTPGSDLLQRAFFILAIALIGIAHVGVKRASLACGDGPGVAAALARRFDLMAAAWVLVVIVAAVKGVLREWDWRPPLFPILAAFMAAYGVFIARSTFGDRLPLAYLVLFQSFRLPLELVMHRAYTEGVMPVQMSYSGRNFDIITGVTALVLGVAMLMWTVPKSIVWVWNVMGLALLVNIVGVAILSLPLVQFFGPDRVNTFVTYPPYVLLPSIMVLAAWAGHLVIFRALVIQSR